MANKKKENYYNGKVDDFSAMLISAERYALGRQTYIVNWTCKFISNNLHLLTQKDKLVMIKDIESASNYGADFDKKDWMNLLKELKKSAGMKNDYSQIKDKELKRKLSKKDCDTCKHFYDLSDYGDIHTLCHQKVCYMCMTCNYKECPLYEEGDVPEGKIRGE